MNNHRSSTRIRSIFYTTVLLSSGLSDCGDGITSLNDTDVGIILDAMLILNFEDISI